MSYYPCSVCRQPLSWVAQYGQYYCYHCQRYYPPAQQAPTADQVVASIEQAVAQTPSYPCNVCQTPLQYVQQYQRWYCARCMQYK
ncbi:MAG: hypothetical protein HZB92_00335 [Euryarchaeota archaeon]|nr:hypothetical protein [Euryarchaeota archaeon]